MKRREWREGERRRNAGGRAPFGQNFSSAAVGCFAGGCQKVANGPTFHYATTLSLLSMPISPRPAFLPPAYYSAAHSEFLPSISPSTTLSLSLFLVGNQGPHCRVGKGGPSMELQSGRKKSLSFSLLPLNSGNFSSLPRNT